MGVSHSRWVRASYFYCGAALAAGIGVVVLRVVAGPEAALPWAIAAIPLIFWVIVRASLYTRVYRGKSLAMMGLVLAFLGFSDAVGQISYHHLWRKAFLLTGRDVAFENPTDGWRVRYPQDWTSFTLKIGRVTTYVFKPKKLTPGLEFSLTHRPAMMDTDLESAVNLFILDLPKSGDTQILSRGPARYPRFQKAYEIVYEDPKPTIVLRHRVVFLAGAEGLTVLSVAAVPHWMDRLAADANHFLFSYEPI
ncbi:MAG: hypothetical protein IPN19_09240 [Elusimicrobia bacterium]|nr:hypothetical protein [Elusimicrobiota bacterium]